jgi:drug/metabolite transporter (DMT)-like permease
MLAAGLALTGMFAIGKHLARDLPVFEVSLFRFAGALLFFLPWVARHRMDGLRTQRITGHLVRAFFGAASLFCMMYSVAHLLLADATVLGFTIPLWNIVMSALFLGERIRLRRTLATVVGFIGVIIVVKPQGGVEPAALVAIGGAMLASCALITMKDLTRTEPSDRIVFYFLLFGSLMMGVPAALVWQPPTVEQWLWILLLGLFGSSGQLFLTRGYAAGEVTIVAPMDFLRVIIAGLIGFVIFDELPDIWAFVGSAVVIGACIYVVRREAMLKTAPKPD